jgi:hypothetical protein
MPNSSRFGVSAIFVQLPNANNATMVTFRTKCPGKGKHEIGVAESVVGVISDLQCPLATTMDNKTELWRHQPELKKAATRRQFWYVPVHFYH